MEGSFADAANNHGFKRSRWRLLWRHQIQDYFIAAVQNVRILLRHAGEKPKAAMRAVGEGFAAIISATPSITIPCNPCLRAMKQSRHCFQPENIPAQHPFFDRSFFYMTGFGQHAGKGPNSRSYYPSCHAAGLSVRFGTYTEPHGGHLTLLFDSTSPNPLPSHHENTIPDRYQQVCTRDD